MHTTCPRAMRMPRGAARSMRCSHSGTGGTLMLFCYWFDCSVHAASSMEVSFACVCANQVLVLSVRQSMQHPASLCNLHMLNNVQGWCIRCSTSCYCSQSFLQTNTACCVCNLPRFSLRALRLFLELGPPSEITPALNSQRCGGRGRGKAGDALGAAGGF